MTELTDFTFPQAIYKRKEIQQIGDYLMSFQQDLIDEFMSDHSSVKAACVNTGRMALDRRHHGIPLMDSSSILKTKNAAGDLRINPLAWKNVLFRYEKHFEGQDISYTVPDDHEYTKQYPTAFKLIKEFGDKCPIANYSSMAPNTVLQRHTGPENRDGQFLRIHIPLIIPEGDIFLEVNGEVVDWSDIFGFNNQLAHSSWNMSPHYRVIFLIDLDREFIGLPYGEPYDSKLEKFAKPFTHVPKE
jgi:hypothetical protein